MLPIGTLLFGNTLEIQSVLGRGGFGIVYKALHLEKQKYVLTAEEAKQALLTILEVLEELHNYGFLHRDIKPASSS